MPVLAVNRVCGVLIDGCVGERAIWRSSYSGKLFATDSTDVGCSAPSALPLTSPRKEKKDGKEKTDQKYQRSSLKQNGRPLFFLALCPSPFPFLFLSDSSGVSTLLPVLKNYINSRHWVESTIGFGRIRLAGWLKFEDREKGLRSGFWASTGE